MVSSFVKFLIAEELADSQSRGTYVGARLDLNSADLIEAWLIANKIPNATPREKFHVTILYSRKECPNYTPLGRISPPFIAAPSNIEAWDTRDGKRALVLKLNSPVLITRHNELMREHGATFDFPTYKPHLTLSYDIGDMSIKGISIPKFDLAFNEEYHEPLNLAWNTSVS